ncbi:MAG: HAD-IIB family hydrolase [Actinobacteria bacterium]|nr:HAD-IIB family hydrolase [Actinomycetota bacterium]
MKQLIVFDLDGTLAESKSTVDPEMVSLLNSLLAITKIAVISGGDWPQFQRQLLAQDFARSALSNLFLLPTCGTKFFRYSSDWDEIYSDDLTDMQKEQIIKALNTAMASLELTPAKVWGEIIEDRGSQITFSALGQAAPIAEKKEWDPGFVKRKKMQELLTQLIPDFSVRLGGTTSIDVTRPGIDKAYGIAKLEEILHIDRAEMLFVGDALFPGGNDYPVKEAGVFSIQVRDQNETKRVIETIVGWVS